MGEKAAGESREIHIKLLVEIRNTYPKFSRYDEVLFTLGFRIETLDWRRDKQAYLERARVFYMELVEDHRDSRFIPLARFLFAEHYLFDAGDYKRAPRGYEMAARSESTLLSLSLERKAYVDCLIGRTF